MFSETLAESKFRETGDLLLHTVSHWCVLTQLQNYIWGKEKIKQSEKINKNLANGLDIAYDEKCLLVYCVFITEWLKELFPYEKYRQRPLGNDLCVISILGSSFCHDSINCGIIYNTERNKVLIL